MCPPDMYSVACTVVADVKSAVRNLPRQTGRNGKEYFIFSHEVQLLLGLTEHEAQVSWKERVSDFNNKRFGKHLLMIVFVCRDKKGGEWEDDIVPLPILTKSFSLFIQCQSPYRV